MIHKEYVKFIKENTDVAIKYNKEDDYCEIFFEHVKSKKQMRAVIQKLHEYYKEYNTK